MTAPGGVAATAGVIVITGAPGAGKTTLARRLAEISPAGRTACMRADDVFAWLSKGRIEPWEPEAHAQNAAVIGAVAGAAFTLAVSGCEVTLDGVLGPWFLAPFKSAAKARRIGLDYVVLRPSEAATLERALTRAGHPLADPERVVSGLWAQFARLGPLEGHAVDTTSLSVEASAALVREGLEAGRFRLA